MIGPTIYFILSMTSIAQIFLTEPTAQLYVGSDGNLVLKWSFDGLGLGFSYFVSPFLLSMTFLSTVAFIVLLASLFLERKKKNDKIKPLI